MSLWLTVKTEAETIRWMNCRASLRNWVEAVGLFSVPGVIWPGEVGGLYKMDMPGVLRSAQAKGSHGSHQDLGSLSFILRPSLPPCPACSR